MNPVGRDTTNQQSEKIVNLQKRVLELEADNAKLRKVSMSPRGNVFEISSDSEDDRRENGKVEFNLQIISYKDKPPRLKAVHEITKITKSKITETPTLSGEDLFAIGQNFIDKMDEKWNLQRVQKSNYWGNCSFSTLLLWILLENKSHYQTEEKILEMLVKNIPLLEKFHLRNLEARKPQILLKLITIF